MSDFASPGSVSGMEYSELNGHLLLIEPIAWETGVKTSYSGPEGSNAVRADVYDLTDNTAYSDTLIFPRVLASSLRSRIGQKVLGVLGQGNAKPGQNAPWVLNDASGDPQAVAKAQKYLSTREFAPPAAAAPASTPAAQVAQAFGAPPF